jgi:hypothetical protein
VRQSSRTGLLGWRTGYEFTRRSRTDHVERSATESIRGPAVMGSAGSEFDGRLSGRARCRGDRRFVGGRGDPWAQDLPQTPWVKGPSRPTG